MWYQIARWGANNPFLRMTLRPAWWFGKRAIRRRRLTHARKRLVGFVPPYRINAGCGEAYMSGWINIDVNADVNQVDLVWDLARELPFPDESCEVIFSEHVLEHLAVEQGVSFLRECHRTLCEGGVVRIAMPSLDDLIEKSATGNWRDQSWLREESWKFIQSRAEMFNIFFRWWGHQWIYDREELHRRLKEAGFEKIRDVSWGESEVETLNGLETRCDSLLICEAVKASLNATNAA
ncbi:MAG: methyltransferase domain-containing protein [Pirellulaceae bacterium]